MIDIMKGCIYKITNLINSKIYIGQTINMSEKYFGSGVLIRSAIKKHGKENFSKEILKDNIKTQKILDTLEEFYIKKFDSTNKEKGYNILPGTSKGFNGVNPMTIPEIRERVKILLKGNGKGKKKDPKHAAKLRANILTLNRKGAKMSEKSKQKISENHVDVSGINNPMFGTSWKDNEQRMLKHMEKVCTKVEYYNPETGKSFQQFNTITEASEYCGGSVSGCIRGKSKTAGGLYWRKIA